MIRLTLLCIAVFSLGQCQSEPALDLAAARDRDAIRWQLHDAMNALEREERQLREELRGGAE